MCAPQKGKHQHYVQNQAEQTLREHDVLRDARRIHASFDPNFFHRLISPGPVSTMLRAAAFLLKKPAAHAALVRELGLLLRLGAMPATPVRAKPRFGKSPDLRLRPSQPPTAPAGRRHFSKHDDHSSDMFAL